MDATINDCNIEMPFYENWGHPTCTVYEEVEEVESKMQPDNAVESYDMVSDYGFAELEESTYEICWNVGEDPKTVLAEFKHGRSFEDLSNRVEWEFVFTMSSNGNMFSIDSELLEAGLVSIRKPQN